MKRKRPAVDGDRAELVRHVGSVGHEIVAPTNVNGGVTGSPVVALVIDVAVRRHFHRLGVEVVDERVLNRVADSETVVLFLQRIARRERQPIPAARDAQAPDSVGAEDLQLA